MRADNSEPRPGSATQHTIPLLGDFFVHGGIYRPVFLVSVAPSHIALDDFGGHGLYATSELTADGDAEVRVMLRLSDARRGQRLVIAIADAAGRTVASSKLEVSEGQREARTSLSLASTRLWRGRADPPRRSCATRWNGNSWETDAYSAGRSSHPPLNPSRSNPRRIWGFLRITAQTRPLRWFSIIAKIGP